MKAYDIAGKRKGAKINQPEFALRIGWRRDTLSDVEIGNVDISSDQHADLHKALDAMIAESGSTKQVPEKDEVAA